MTTWWVEVRRKRGEGGRHRPELPGAAFCALVPAVRAPPARPGSRHAQPRPLPRPRPGPASLAAIGWRRRNARRQGTCPQPSWRPGLRARVLRGRSGLAEQLYGSRRRQR